MIGKYIKGKAAVFIDAANILYSQRTLGWYVDYEKLRAYFEKECDLASIHFYTGKVGTDDKQGAFLRKLARLGYVVKEKEVKRIKVSPGTYQMKGSLDAELIIDALKYSDTYDTFVLMSGDSDFAPLIDELKARRKRVIVMSTKRHVARELVERAKYVNIKKLEREISYKKVPPARSRGEV